MAIVLSGDGKIEMGKDMTCMIVCPPSECIFQLLIYLTSEGITILDCSFFEVKDNDNPMISADMGKGCDLTANTHCKSMSFLP